MTSKRKSTVSLSGPGTLNYIMNREFIELSRDCDVICIPAGITMTLPAGTRVTVTQALGGTYTAVSDQGYMVQIAGKDADVLGMKPSAESPAETSAAGKPDTVEDKVWQQLRTCYDPEIPIDIVELGLVYSCEVTGLPEGGNRVDVKFTLTAQGCGMGHYLAQDIEHKLALVQGVTEVNVDVVLNPPWNRDMISEGAKLNLGLL